MAGAPLGAPRSAPLGAPRSAPLGATRSATLGATRSGPLGVPRNSTLGAARAAWLLAAGLFLWPLLPDRAPEVGCPQAAALDAPALHSRRVSCNGGAPLRGPARLLFGLRLDLNRADAASLQSLPGIGAVRSAAILAERELRPFESLEALTRVRGIGPRILAGLRPWLEVATPRAPGAPRGADARARLAP